MRSDMHEVVIERPRGGPRMRRRIPRWNLAMNDHESIPSRESMSRRRGGTKHLSDLLGPLRRFLRSAVGRPWDDVYSEIRAGLSPDSVIHMHILEHVEAMIGRDWPFQGEFVVCSQTGLLRRVEGNWRSVRDPGRGDLVSVRRFLLRRVGKPWVDVEAELRRAAPKRPYALPVTMNAVRVKHRGRQVQIHAWREATDTAPAGPGAALVRGALYVESGVLGLVR